MPEFTKLFEAIEDNEFNAISRLGQAVAIESVSGEPDKRPEVVRMAEWLAEQLKTLGATDIELKDLGYEHADYQMVPPAVSESEHNHDDCPVGGCHAKATKPENATPPVKLPPVVVARVGQDPKKKTVLIYGHYDVQPAQQTDGWLTNPFKLTLVKDKLIARGSTDDKGPVCGWLNVLEAHKEIGLDIPVNIVFCFEGMEESGSVGLEELIKREADGYFKGVDAVCISDNYWLGTKHPVVTYGVRGVSYYQIEIDGPQADLHSGLFGGIVNEPLIDLTYVMSQLATPQGEILIDGIKDMVAPLTNDEDKLYDDIHFTLEELEQNVGSKTVIQDNIKAALQARWRYPSLSLHGIEGAFSEPGAKTVIPAKVKGKFSIRTVPNIEPAKLDQLVFDHVNKSFAKLNSKNQVKVSLVHGGDYWVTDPTGWSYKAAAQATKEVWGVEPDYTREGGSIPITLSFQNILNTSVVLLPMGRGDDGAHSTNEKLNTDNYNNGTKTLAAYLHYLAEN